MHPITRNDIRMSTMLAMTALALTFVTTPIARAQQYVEPTTPVMPTAPSAVFAASPVVTTAPVYTAAPAYTTATTAAAAYTYAAPVAPAYTYAAPAVTYAATYGYSAMTGGGDPYGFTNWLNGVRAQYGLRPVSYDANLASWASANNAQQAARGLGHYVMGPARRQNSAMGSAASIGSQWMNSPAHRSALLDPSITTIGLAGNGAYWTFNAR